MGAAATTVSAHRQTDPAKLSQLLRRDLDWIVMKALQKDRSRRYQTASDFARDIQRYLADEPIEARPPTLADRAAKWARHHRPVVWAAAVLLVLCSIGSLVSTLLIAREHGKTVQAYEDKAAQLEATERAEKLAKRQEQMAKQQERLAKEQERLAKEQEKLAEAQKQEAIRQRDISDRNLYVAHMRLAQRDWELGQIRRLHAILDRHVPQPGRSDLRGWEWYYFLSLCHSDLMTLPGHNERVNCVAWSPDGKRLATASTGQRIAVWNAATGEEILALQGHRGSVTSVAWSADGTRLALAHFGSSTVELRDAATGKVIATRRGEELRGKGHAMDGQGNARAAGQHRAVASLEPPTHIQALVPGGAGDVGDGACPTPAAGACRRLLQARTCPRGDGRTKPSGRGNKTSVRPPNTASRSAWTRSPRKRMSFTAA